MTQSQSSISRPLKQVEYVALCVILARKEINSKWSDYIWEPVGVVLDPPKGINGKIREKGDGWTHFFMECEPLELHRKDAPAYRESLLQDNKGSLWIVLGENDDVEEPLPYYVQLVTASAYEAQDYLDSGELIVEVVEMPDNLRNFVGDYVDRCPEEEKFIKRKQKKKFHEEHNFGQQPLHEILDLEKKRHEQ